MHVAVIGGGVIGLCCAYYLQKTGCQVTVIDKYDITHGTSFGNAGYVSPSHFVPLASPGIIAKGLRWMLSSSSPFYIKPTLKPDVLKWIWTFWRNANQKTVEKNAPHLSNLLHLSRELTVHIKNDLGNHFRMEEKGCFMLYKSANIEKHEIEMAKTASQLGIEAIVLSAEKVQEMEPEITVDVRGGVLYPIDCHLHPGDFMATLKNHLQKEGIVFNYNATVTNFESNGSTIKAIITDKGKIICDEVVLANGSWLPSLAKLLQIKVLLQAGKGYSITYEKISKNLHYPAILVDKRVAMTPMGADLRIGGTMEISGLNSPVLIKRAKAIFNAAKYYYPDLPIDFPAADKIWSGLRPLTPDGLPYISRHSSYNNLTIASGHAMLGLSLAAGTGKVVAEIIKNDKPSIDISAFRTERFG
ncbi:MAG: NAD(P)/FAD-dependent oxidoreductase [Chitinophagaceae bacterium]